MADSKWKISSLLVFLFLAFQVFIFSTDSFNEFRSTVSLRVQYAVGMFGHIAQAVAADLTLANITNNLIEGTEQEAQDKNSIYVQFWTFGKYYDRDQRYIMYNWEQMRILNFWNHLDLMIYSRYAFEIWDYSFENQKYFQSWGINSIVVIPNYHPSMPIAPHNPSRPLTISFWGSINERRRKLIEKINIEYPLNQIKIISNSSEFDNTRIILNIHSWPDDNILEVHRLSQVIASRVICLSERSTDIKLDQYFEPMVTFFDMDNFKEKIGDILAMSDIDYNALTLERLDYFKSLPSIKDQLIKGNSKLFRLQYLS
jgi:hypothetical protein